MINSILKIIKEDLQNRYDLKEIYNQNIFSLHFGICQYIRNNYLWGNEFTVRILSVHFKACDIDDLSHKILEDVIKDL